MKLVDLLLLPLEDRCAWLLRSVIEPELAVLRAFGIPSDDRARQMMTAIAGQESEVVHRDQVDGGGRDVLGPALSFWQMERGGGVAGVLNHHASRSAALARCGAFDVSPDADTVWRALKVNDALAATFARLLLWTDAKPLPVVQDASTGWSYYLRTWRPGKPHPETWTRNWDAARAALRQLAE